MAKNPKGWHLRIGKSIAGLLLCLSICNISVAQSQPPAQPAPAPEKNSGEMVTRDSSPTFSTRANLVLVRVVVRDHQGRANGTLQKEDFQLFDKGKPQIISKFSVEKTEGRKAESATSANGPPKSPEEPAAPLLPDRYVAYIFDNVHLSFGDLAMARKAAEHHLSESLTAASRAAVYTTSGQPMLDFTDDIAKLRDTLNLIRPRSVVSVATGTGLDCPNLTYYQADLIQNKNDPQALEAAIQDTFVCANLDPQKQRAAAQGMAQGAASRVVNVESMETHQTLQLLATVVRRLAGMPGLRSVVVVSPGFLVLNERFDELEVMDRAIRSNVTISSLDARGLYTIIPGGDASQSAGNIATLGLRSLYQSASALAEGDVLAELADGTGGTFFHNSNDLEGGFKRIAAPPEYYYVLGFSPQNLKFDGSYHNLKVSLQKNFTGFTLQARRGYFAPKHEVDAAQEAKREVEEALFTRDEWHDIPVALHTQFFKSSDENAKLSVLARIDVRQLRYRKEDGRNLNILTVVSGVFDRNGNYVGAIEKTVTMHLKDETLANRLASGITVKSAFDVTPGNYFVRIVVRDAEGQKMAALNGAVDIP